MARSALVAFADDGAGELLPELVRRDDWGSPIIDRRPFEAKPLLLVKRAVAACPMLALRVVDVPA